ncbi:N-acetylmuramoyl-L-alanine amidase [Richelia intracellularis HH01]|uniref:N-acetylmuramoyl-L-alanine amidase n=1 Tax=Richelia intracellularis HH01 TaxID=1165094 RepID=M1WRZ9_9NOST|nr:N-acetylmuramoyl-L-alanine amidase [Richelia intracellularis]CCH67169.1 N-acetylmuramoyl-L-alanine amidase [Richelia intracellularis HH01]HAE05292.1 cell wall hydrolase [Richelia sp.]
MGRIFISAAHGGREWGRIDPGSIAGGTTEAREMILLRDLIVTELRTRSFEVLSVPDSLSAANTINWINSRDDRGDIAVEIHMDAARSPFIRGASAFYIASNNERKKHADLLLLKLLSRVTQLPNLGSKPDTDAGLGNLAFCRQVAAPSVYLQVGFLSSPDDRALLQNHRHDFAQGVADGLESWSQFVRPDSPPLNQPEKNYPIINIKINGQNYPEQGILVNGNSYIPVDLADCLRIDLSKSINVRRISYRQVVYIKAIELREFNVFVGWNEATRTAILRSNLTICPGQIDLIMSHGNTTEVQLQLFLQNNNKNALTKFPNLPELYREEGTTEGVNYDIAFCQMCIETGFLEFSSDIRPEQNNFAGLGTFGGGLEVASFSSPRLGVRAHIQHLKAYASLEPIVQDIVDPRFRFVTRGVAPLINQLSGRWSADIEYGYRLIAMLKRLYELAQLM